MDSRHLEHMSVHQPRRILFLYGSQTGCAQDVAENAAREARRLRFSASVSSMDDYDRSLLIREHFVVFIASTTGQGEEPDNMKKFWKFLLRKSHPKDALEHLEYTVFGLGDSSYIKFNWPAKKLYKRLMQLGARPIYEPGYADDQHYLGVDGTLGPWIEGFWKLALEKFPLPPGVEPIPKDQVFENTFTLTFDDEDSRPLPLDAIQDPIEEASYTATLLQSKRITHPEHSQDVRHIALSITDPVFPGYHPGDVLTMRPKNLATDVDEFLEYHGWSDIADKPLTIRPNFPDHPLPKHLSPRQTLRSLFTNHLNVFTTPRTSFFQLLVHFTPNEDEKEKLREFVSPQGQDDLYSYCHRVRRTIFECLKDFKDARIPINYILDVYPWIMPRSFSIASAPLESVKQQQQLQEGVVQIKQEMSEDGGELEWKIELCIAIVYYKTKIWKWRTGICTKWLKSLTPDASDQANGAEQNGNADADPAQLPPPPQFAIKIQRGTLKLPKDPSVPLICIGPGTGVAPMRSFLYHRIYAQGARDNILFFGCRHRDRDYHYRQEWEKLEQDGYLRAFAACSRDQDSKVYVQHLLEQQSELLWNLIHERQGVILLSGSSGRMPTDVTRALERVAAKEGHMSIEDAHDYVSQLEKLGRFQQECWS